ncbi:MAG: cardiolipin synthase [Gammaproteobacteria bacterium]|nr:cardiolipin synthase [Gammaproteobacteria bacterium]NND61065.1 cardiolipin synthase [Gammaproteobacteria bacterium]
MNVKEFPRIAQLVLLLGVFLPLGACLNHQPPEKSTAGVEKIAVEDGASYDIVARRAAIDGNRVELLLDGPATYDAMFDAIATASDHINLETFILADDVIGKRLADLLIDRVADGVVVNLIYDAFGSGMTSDEFFDRLEDNGINVLAYNTVFEGDPLDLLNRNHRKVLVVDGRIGFTGGLNFTRKYRFSSENPPAESRFGAAWRDTHIRIEGPAVAELQRAFLRNWAANADQPLAAASYFPQLEPVGQSPVLVEVAEGGDGRASAIFEHYLEAVRAAKERIWIVQAYFIPSEDLLDELVHAANRGVDVRLVLPKRTDNGLTVPATRSYYSRLLENGIRIFEYESSHLHAKTALIDHDWTTVGSSNLDTLSYLYNDELNAFILDQQFNDQLASSFIDDMSESREITEEAWDDRGIWPRTKEIVARFLKPVL